MPFISSHHKQLRTPAVQYLILPILKSQLLCKNSISNLAYKSKSSFCHVFRFFAFQFSSMVPTGNTSTVSETSGTFLNNMHILSSTARYAFKTINECYPTESIQIHSHPTINVNIIPP